MLLFPELLAALSDFSLTNANHKFITEAQSELYPKTLSSNKSDKKSKYVWETYFSNVMSLSTERVRFQLQRRQIRMVRGCEKFLPAVA